MNTDVNIFKSILDGDAILINEPMKRHTTYKIGGKCDVMLLPSNAEQVSVLIKTCRDNGIPYYVIGNGSNLLVRDGGIRGAVIKISERLSYIDINGSTIRVGAGMLLSTVVKRAYENLLSGLEFAAGIPGSVGGAVTMNAGAYGGNMSQIVKSVTVCDTDGNVKILMHDELKLGYRQSVIRDEKLTVLEVVLELKKGEKESIKAEMDRLNAKRRSMQPLNFPSCGSVFKRPEGYFVGKLIEDAGLKGTTVGGAQVSELHANFIVNINGATARDVLELIEIIKKTVFEKFGVAIETEVITIGED